MKRPGKARPASPMGPAGTREDSPICLIHFSHPFVYIEDPAELEDSCDCSSDEDSLSDPGVRGDEDAPRVDPSQSLLPFERVLEEPSRDLLTQLLFPELSHEDAKGSLSAVLKMLRDAWSRSRPNSGTNVAPTRHRTTTTTTTSISNRRRLSAPETRIRRFTVRTTTNVETSSYREPLCKSAPPVLTTMCTDSILCQQNNVDTSPSSIMNHKYNDCYCHTYTQNEYKFSCKLHFEENSRTTHLYNCNYNYIENSSRQQYYVPKLVPRYSSLPRSMSMVANCSSSSSSNTSSGSDDDCQSLADSLEDVSRAQSRLAYDEKPVRGAPPLMPHRHAPRAPIAKGEKFFVPLTDQEIKDEMLMLPPTLREKLERRRQELDKRPRNNNINRTVIVAQKSPRQVRSRRIIGTKFQRFECIPEENDEARRGRNRFPASRTYLPRPPQLTQANRGLQAIVRDPREAKVGLQDMGISRQGVRAILPVTGDDEGIQEVMPVNRQDMIALPRSRQAVQGILPVPRGKQAMGEDLVAVTTGWVNFYMLKGEEQSTTGSSDNNTGSSSGRKSRRYSRGKSPRGASLTEVSMTGRSSTVRVQQTRPLNPRRAYSDPEPESPHKNTGMLPRLSTSSGGYQPSLPALRGPVPLIRVKHPTNEDSVTSEVSLPALPPAHLSSTSSSDTPASNRTRTKAPSSSSSGPRALVHLPSARRTARQQRQLAKPVHSVIAENTPAPPGTWSVTVSGVCPQPEMEVRLVFPPAPEPPIPAVTAGGAEPVPGPAAISQQSDSGLGEENNGGGGGDTVDTTQFTLMFKSNNSQNGTAVEGANRGGRSASAATPTSRRGSPASSPRRRTSLKALPSPPDRMETRMEAPALDEMMWPEMQALLQEQVMHIKKQTTSYRGGANSATLVERLRGGEGVEQIQQVQQLAVRGAAITTRRKKRTSS